MEQTRYVNLPVIGRVQHGEKIINNNGGTKLLEYGHFIAKIQDEFMQKFLERFNELYTEPEKYGLLNPADRA